MQRSRTHYLLQQYINHKLTAHEREELLTILHQPNDASLEKIMLEQMEQAADVPVLISETDTVLLFRNIVDTDKTVAGLSVPVTHSASIKPFLHRYWVAASILLVLTVGTYLWLTDKKESSTTAGVAKTIDIYPGKNGAILTLSDGSQVPLDSLQSGIIATQQGAQVLLQNGRLAYHLIGPTADEVAYNTMQTPNGRQFSMLLPDGTGVWLNAASSITYPTAFKGEERKVEVTGEVYFEVAKNTKMPFKVKVNNKAEIEVLGTHFNVNAYEDESKINTTLLEGSVRVSALPSRVSAKDPSGTLADNSVILVPGQQAIIQINKHTLPGIILVPKADTEQIMAWKSGLFNFNGVSFQALMKDIERWYDIQVKYEGRIPTLQLKGKMDRGITLVGLMRLLQNEVPMKLQGRTLIVTEQ